MKKRNTLHDKLNNICFGAGFIGILLYYLPYFILGQDASFRISDYLDDEVVQLLLNSKYLFAPSDTIVQEWLSGAPLGSIQPPCFLPIFIFMFFPFYHAILLIGLFGTTFGYIGMYLLCNKLLHTKYCYISLMAALLYCILPYYPSYGLSSVGLPLVVWACINLCETKKGENYTDIPYYATLIFYSLSSSFVWAGYFVVGFMFITGIFLLLKKKQSSIKILCSSIVMLIIYCLIFKETLASILTKTYVSHRNDPGKIYISENFVDNFLEMFKYGQYHVPSLHTYIMAFSLCVIILGWLFFKKLSTNSIHKLLLATSIWVLTLFIALFHAFYNSPSGLEIRKYLGGFESFQIDRIYWTYPMLWYTELAICTYLFFEIIEVIGNWILVNISKSQQVIRPFIHNLFFSIIRTSFVVFVTTFMAYYIIHHPNSIEYYSNILKLSDSKTNQISYHEFYDHELFNEIKNFIGRNQSDYRIGCIGFVPAIASINGFYTVDGYSTNYPLEYKLAFREVIATELEKNPIIKQYYDNWGSRCYLFSAELGLDYDIRKDEDIVIQNLQINTDKLKSFGCEYILSSVKIENASDLGMNLLNRFEGDAIEIFVYKL